MTAAQHTPAPMTERERELLELLLAAQELGLRFDIGTAYIRRSYIDKQDALNARIAAAVAEARAAIAKAEGSAS